MYNLPEWNLTMVKGVVMRQTLWVRVQCLDVLSATDDFYLEANLSQGICID